MKSTVLRVALFATSTIALGWSVPAAGGQQRVTANVPFSFRAGASSAPAGHYQIDPNYLVGVTMLHNTDTRTHVSVFRQGAVFDPRDSRPRLVFRCNSTGCALSQIFTGMDGWQLPSPQLSPAEKERLAVVYFTPTTGGN